MAWFGHTGSQASHAVHPSVIINAMIASLASGRLWHIALRGELVEPVGAPERGPNGAGVDRIRMAADHRLPILHPGDVLRERCDQTTVECQPAGHHHDASRDPDRLE